MKVYLDKGKLESYDIQQITDLGGRKFMQVRMWMEDTNNVEIVDLTDYTKQVRKEVCEEISWKLNRRLNGVVNGKYSDEFFNGYGYCSSDIENILDQIQGE